MAVEVAIRGLRSGYGPLEVLHGVDLDIPGGLVTGLLGPNGAGKTTFLRTLAGHLQSRAGRVWWQGDDIERWSPEQRAERGLVFVPADNAVFPSLSVRDNLDIFSQGAPLDAAFAAFPVLESRLQQRAGTLSGGEQRMLAMSRALLVRPALLLADEPSLGLSATLTAQIYDVIASVAATGVTVVVADQYVERIQAMAAVIYRLEHGEVAFAGEPSELATGAAASS
jgi:branched-chain amino acid transport system ATP-binding protein